MSEGFTVQQQTEARAPKPPKALAADPIALAQAYRHGVTQAIWMRERRILPSATFYVVGGSQLLRFADRVRIEWMRRHPAPATVRAIDGTPE